LTSKLFLVLYISGSVGSLAIVIKAKNKFTKYAHIQITETVIPKNVDSTSNHKGRIKIPKVKASKATIKTVIKTLQLTGRLNPFFRTLKEEISVILKLLVELLLDSLTPEILFLGSSRLRELILLFLVGRTISFASLEVAELLIKSFIGSKGIGSSLIPLIRNSYVSSN